MRIGAARLVRIRRKCASPETTKWSTRTPDRLWVHRFEAPRDLRLRHARPPLRSIPLWPGVGTSHNRSERWRRRTPPQRTEGGSIHAGRPTPDRRRAGPSVEGGVAGLEMGSWAQAAVAGAFHYRAAGADDGRSGRRSRGDRAAVLARRPQRLCARGGQALSRALPRDGPHPAAGSQVGGSVAEMEAAAGDAGRARDLQQPAYDPLAHGRHRRLVLAGAATAVWFWPAAEKAGLPVMCFAPGRTAAFGQIAQKHPQLTLIIDHMGVNMAMADDGRLEGAIGETVALAKYPNVSVKLSASPG